MSFKQKFYFLNKLCLQNYRDILIHKRPPANNVAPSYQFSITVKNMYGNVHFMNLDWVEIGAALGAGSWLPHLINMGKATFVYWKKPTVSIRTEKQVRIGFDHGVGPQVGLRLSINVDKSDCLIENINLILTHQDKGEKSFNWYRTSKNFSAKKGIIEKKEPLKFNWSPISLKISSASSREIFVDFCCPSFSKKRAPINDALADKIKKIKLNNSKENDERMIEAMNSDEAKNYRNLAEENFFWRAGKYRIHFDIKTNKRVRLKNMVADFTLDQSMINNLRENLIQIDQAIKNTVTDGKQQMTSFFSYPTIEKLEN